MSDLFLPKEQKELEELLNKEEIYDIEEAVEETILFASGNSIYHLLDSSTTVQVAQRDSEVEAMCLHYGRLYDAGLYCKIYDTLENDVVGKRDAWIRALCSHNGLLMDGGNYGGVCNSFLSKNVAERTQGVNALCSFNGFLYDGGFYRRVYETFNEKLIMNFHEDVNFLCPHKGKCYAALDYEVVDLFSGNVVAQRKSWVLGLMSHNGVLYDHCNNGEVCDTFSGELVFTWDEPITCMLSVPRGMFEKK